MHCWLIMKNIYTAHVCMYVHMCVSPIHHCLLHAAVENLLSAAVKNYVEIEKRIAQGTKNRTLASTNMNATSRYVRMYKRTYVCVSDFPLYCTYPPIHSYTYPPIHSYTYTPIHSYTYPPIHSYTYPLSIYVP